MSINHNLFHPSHYAICIERVVAKRQNIAKYLFFVFHHCEVSTRIS